MSIKDYESLYCKILDLQVLGGDINELFDDDTLNDTKKINWVVEKSAEINNISVIEYLISRGITLGIVNDKNQTAIHVATHNSKFYAVNIMFAHYGSSINYIDNNGLSHFHAACIVGNFEIAEKFLSNGVDANSQFEYQGCKQTPLHATVKFNHVDIVQLLLKQGAQPNLLCSFGRSPMHLVCWGDVGEIGKIMSLLVRYRSGYWEDHSEFNYTFYKKHEKEMEIKNHLIQCGGDVNIQNSSGDTPLHCVFKINHFKHMDSIFPQSIFDFYVLPNIIEKIRNRQKKKIDLLLSNGADVRIVNNKGNTILHLAIRAMKEFRRRYSEAMEFDDCILAEMVENFLSYGADVNAKNKKGQSPLQLAIASLYYRTVKVLLDHGADVTNIHFDWFHYNKDIVPCFLATENLISIVTALEQRGFQLDLKKNLNILKFFVKNNSKHLFAVSTDKEAYYKIKNLLECGTDDNIKLGLEKFSKNTLSNKNESKITRLKSKVAIQIYDHLMILERGNLYASQDVKDYLWEKIKSFISDFSDIEDLDSDIMDEFKDMKRIKLSPGISFREILSIAPQRCYWQIKSGDYMYILSSKGFKEQFSNILGIIEGHFAKTLIRRYVLESARDYLRTLIDLSFPDEICDQIFDYLNNESLFSLCLAAVKLDKKLN